MPRSLEALTLCVWNVLEQDGDATHQKGGRALMKKMGWKVARVPKTGTAKTAEFVKWVGLVDEYEIDYSKLASVKAVAEAIGYDVATAKLMVVEYWYHKEVNDFNVRKVSYKKRKADGLPIPPFVPESGEKPTTEKRGPGRPKGSKNSTPAVGTQPAKRRGPKPKNVIPPEELAAFADIEGRGGLAGAQKQIEDAEALIADLQAKVELVKSLKERVAEAA